MVDWLSNVETDKVIHTIETDIVRLVDETENFSKSSDEFDKETGSSDGLQPKQVDLSCVHALNEFHSHEIHVVLSGRLSAPERIALLARVAIESAPEVAEGSLDVDEGAQMRGRGAWDERGLRSEVGCMSYCDYRIPYQRRTRLIACNIAGRSYAPEKVTVTDLFYLSGIDVDSVNIPYLLARYLRRFALGKKRGDRDTKDDQMRGGGAWDERGLRRAKRGARSDA
nr:hypothetical protein [Tanacetum cinerariifolium]